MLESNLQVPSSEARYTDGSGCVFRVRTGECPLKWFHNAVMDGGSLDLDPLATENATSSPTH